MALDGQQHIDEALAEIRTYRFVLQRAGQADDGDFIGRHREMIGPEMRQPFAKRLTSVRGNSIASRNLIQVHRHKHLANAEKNLLGLSRFARLITLLFAFGATRILGFDVLLEDVGRRRQARDGFRHRTIALDLFGQPAMRVGVRMRQLARSCAQTETIDGDDGILGRCHESSVNPMSGPCLGDDKARVPKNYPPSCRR